MTDALRRALRTFIQAFVGAILASGILSVIATSGVVDWSAVEKVLVSAFSAAVVAVLAWLQNVLEDHDVIPAIAKPTP